METAAVVVPMHPLVDYYKQWEHHKIGTHIRICSDFIVHIDSFGKLDWETTTEFDKRKSGWDQEVKNKLSKVYSEICIAEGLPTKGFDAYDKNHFLKLLGEALVHWLEDDAETAHSIVTAALAFHRERSEEKSREWYVQASIVCASIFATAGILGWLAKSTVLPYVGETGFYAGLATAAGAVGALFSVYVRSGKLRFKASAGLKLHRLEASSRICTGSIAGLLAYLAIKSDLLLGALFQDLQNTSLVLLACIAAGAGERLATSIISKFDESSIEITGTQESVDKGKK